jgi:hypothetical protein
MDLEWKRERACKAERNFTLTWPTQTTMMTPQLLQAQKIGSQHGKTRGFWYPRKRKVQRKDIERLGEGEWLDDEIINSCTEAITREANPKVFMMNSLKFASLEKAIPTGRLRLGKYHTRLAESRYFVVPVHQGGNHWSMGIIISDDRDTPQATVLTVDSLDTYGNKANRGISRSLKSLLRLERGEGYPVHWLHAKNIQQ